MKNKLQAMKANAAETIRLYDSNGGPVGSHEEADYAIAQDVLRLIKALGRCQTQRDLYMDFELISEEKIEMCDQELERILEGKHE